MKAPRLLLSEKKNFEVCLVPMFKIVTPVVGPVLTPEASNVQTWLRSTRKCCIPDIKTLHLPFQRRRILKMGLFVPMFQLVTPGMGPVLTQGASYEHTW